jgi:preprotein translocase subunit SecF
MDVLMQLIKNKISIDFLSRGRRRITFVISIFAAIISLGSIAIDGLEYGIDFTGGVLLEVGYPQEANLERIRQLLGDAGFTDVQVQRFGTATDVLLRLPPQLNSNPNEIRDSLQNTLAADEPNVDLRRVEFVGPQIGKELRERGGLATIFVLLLIFAYVMIRFQWKFAAGAVAALAHDVILTVGFFSIFGLQFDLTVLAAVLAVIGYSLNDTVVTFDRIRESFIKLRGVVPEEVMNISINEMLARTIITGVTTLIVLTALFIFGGESVAPFSIALIVGVIVGTYSSIYTASATALYLNVSAQDLLPPTEDQNLVDDMP